MFASFVASVVLVNKFKHDSIEFTSNIRIWISHPCVVCVKDFLFSNQCQTSLFIFTSEGNINVTWLQLLLNNVSADQSDTDFNPSWFAFSGKAKRVHICMDLCVSESVRESEREREMVHITQRPVTNPGLTWRCCCCVRFYFHSWKHLFLKRGFSFSHSAPWFQKRHFSGFNTQHITNH